MKTKTNMNGDKYLFYEDDYELEGIALKLISLLPKNSGSVGKPLKMRLWDCAFNLIEETPYNSTIFKRSLSIENQPDADRVYNLITEVINHIVKTAGMENEKYAVMEWNDTKTFNNKNGVLVRYSKNGKFIGLKTFTDTLIGSLKDMDALLKRMETSVLEIGWIEFNGLMYMVKQDQSELGDNLLKNEFRTIRVATESLITEKKLETNFKQKIKFGEKINIKSFKDLEGTLDIFDI